MYKVKSLISELTDIDVKNGIVTGYFASFNNIDSDKDMIMPGAFSKTIQERGPGGKNRIFHLLQHDVWKPLGKPQVLKEDLKGLYFETKIVTTSYGIDVLKLYEAGVFNEHSIGYRIIKSEEVLNDHEEFEYQKLHELLLWEGSTVTWGANTETPMIGMKDISQKDVLSRINKRFDKICKAIKINDLSEETYIKLEIELNQLKQIINNLPLDLKEPSQDTKENEPVDIVKYLKDNLKMLK